MRGRLVFVKWFVVSPLDTAATAAAGNYDRHYKIVRLVDTDNNGVGESGRVDGDEIRFPAQIEHDREELQRQTKAGDLPDSAVGLVIRKSYMRRLGLLTTERPLGIKKNDILLRQEKRDGTVVKTFSDPVLYCIHARHLDGIDEDNDPALLIFSDARPQGVS